jgi:glycosyltransferase involved in cell wall biosynthesis
VKLLICTQAVDQHDPILGFFHSWICEFAKHYESVTVVCLRKGVCHLPPHVRVLSLGKEDGRSKVTYLYRFFVYIFHFSSYDSVFVHMNPEYVVLGGWLWKIMHKHIVLWYTHKSVTSTLRLGSMFADTICTASKESFRLKKKHVVVMGHGIDIKLFSRPHARAVSTLRITTVGRVSRSKNIHPMLQAVSGLSKHGIPYRFTIVGGPVTHEDATYYKELKKQVGTLDIQGFVSFVGAKKNTEIPLTLSQSDIFLHTSDTGSLDKAVLEAMAAGCVVISSNDAARPILASIQGALAIPKPDPALLARAIQRMYEVGESGRTRIGERSRAVVMKEHSLTSLIERLVQLLCKKNK